MREKNEFSKIHKTNKPILKQLYHNQALGFHSNDRFQYHAVSMALKCKNQKQQTNTHTVSKHKKQCFNQQHI